MATPDRTRRRSLQRADRARRRVRESQVELDDDSAVAAAWGKEHPDAFGGLWFGNDDAEAGNGPARLAVAVRRGAAPASVDALWAAVQHPDRLDVVPCNRSLRELQALADRIRERHMPDRAAAATRHVLTLSIDVRSGTVEIGVGAPDGETTRRLRDEFAGEPVVIVAAAHIIPVTER